MANIKIELDYPLEDGMSLTFKAPCDSTAVTGLKVYYPEVTESDSTTVNKTFSFRDAHLNALTTIGNLFVAGATVKVVVDTTNAYAFIQNADTNGYLENKIDSTGTDLSKHTTNKSNPHGVTASQVGAIPTTAKGAASGVASLGANGKVPSEQLPENSSAKSVTLTTSGWTLGTDERYYQTVSVSGVTASTPVIVVDVDLSTTDADAKVTFLEAWAGPSANEVTQGDGTLTFYSYDLPTVNIPVNVGVM